jgi:hypothetical protein
LKPKTRLSFCTPGAVRSQIPIDVQIQNGVDSATEPSGLDDLIDGHANHDLLPVRKRPTVGTS